MWTRAGCRRCRACNRRRFTDLKDMRAAEDQILNSYGWVDQRTASCGFRSIGPSICWRSAACRARPQSEQQPAARRQRADRERARSEGAAARRSAGRRTEVRRSQPRSIRPQEKLTCIARDLALRWPRCRRFGQPGQPAPRASVAQHAGQQSEAAAARRACRVSASIRSSISRFRWN